MHTKRTTMTSWIFLRVVVVTVLVFLSLSFAQTITIAAHYSPEESAGLEPCFAAYEAENPGVDIVYQQIAYGDYLQTVITSRIGGQAPDIYHLYNIWGPQMIENGVLAAPPEDVVNWIRENYVAATVDTVTIDGQVWGIPTEVSNYMLVYNKKLLAEAGFDAPPATWEELVTMAEALTKRNDEGNIVQAGYAYGPTTATIVHPFLIMLYSEGVNPFKDDFSGTNLTSPEAIDVLTKQVELYQKGITDRSVEVWNFPSGTVAMMFMAPWYESTLREAFGDEFENTVGVAPIPMGENWRSMQYAFFYGVDANSDVQDEAWQFLQWLNTGQDGNISCMGELLMNLGALTANNGDIAAAQDTLGDFYTKPFVDALERSSSEPNVMQASEIQAALQKYIEQAWAGDLTPEEALTQADQEISNILSEFY
jgi:multiple sugar transport system substrate-binding protein